MLDQINNFFMSFNQFDIIFSNLYNCIELIIAYTEIVLKKLVPLFMYKVLLKKTIILQNCNCLFYNFQDKFMNFQYIINIIKDNIAKEINFINNVYFKINNSFVGNENEKKELLTKIDNIKYFLNENLSYFENHTQLIKNFNENFLYLIKLINEIIEPNN